MTSSNRSETSSDGWEAARHATEALDVSRRARLDHLGHERIGERGRDGEEGVGVAPGWSRETGQGDHPAVALDRERDLAGAGGGRRSRHQSDERVAPIVRVTPEARLAYALLIVTTDVGGSS